MIHTISLDHRSEGVLQEFEANMGTGRVSGFCGTVGNSQMTRDVGEGEVFWAEQLDRGSLE